MRHQKSKGLRLFLLALNHLQEVKPYISADPMRRDFSVSRLLIDPRDGEIQPTRQLLWRQQLLRIGVEQYTDLVADCGADLVDQKIKWIRGFFWFRHFNQRRYDLLLRYSEPTTFPPADFPSEIPSRFFQIFNRIGFQIRSPAILHHISKTKIHVLNDLDAFNTAPMRSVMLWMINRVR
jgi:hypothetical protein